ncbi:N-acetylglucosamine kinase 1 [Lodderomyces elongisporus]|uniref:N-acetylglucosamine kinase 1 n=1 Tax=Lodderomyces elongisporus TaxID=36914 RepID=UPI002923B6CA|nr:N-acetylglucosamine kinase 1 [Lodderomyces elongisporus]WLF79401.1 N-acetylglucosamine kinase 1 [Lodderomyces elongisporus]
MAQHLASSFEANHPDGLQSLKKEVNIRINSQQISGLASSEEEEEDLKSLESSTGLSPSPSSPSPSPSSSSFRSPSATPMSSNESGEYSETSSVLDSAVASFTESLTDKNLCQQSDLLYHDFKSSLAEDALAMLPNYNLSPTGEESGSYLVIDLGGSTLRVAVVDISPDLDLNRKERVKVVIEDKWIISNEYKNIDLNFFKFIASKTMEILSKQSAIDSKELIKTGITWSFPLETTDYNNGNILHVSKGYTVDPEVHGQNLKSLLETTFLEEFNVEIDVRSILNDSLAVYSAGLFLNSTMKLAMVLGTGFNLCCSLNSHEQKMHSAKLIDDKILFNTELSFFGQGLVPHFMTKYDGIIDKRLVEAEQRFKAFSKVDPETNSVFQPNELTTSGRYLPELCRLVIADLWNQKEIFTTFSEQEMDRLLNVSYDGFEGEIMCIVDECNDYQEINAKMCKCYNWNKAIPETDIKMLKTITAAVIQRAAFIVANSIIAFFKLQREFNTDDQLKGHLSVGFVGSVLVYFHNYRDLVLKYVNSSQDAQREGYTIDLQLVENSSIVGAAIGAAYHS